LRAPGAAGNDELSVDNIRFAYNSHHVLENVTFAVEKGRVLAILGVNGAGKSTLLKCLNRILRPQAGAASLGGEDLLGMSRRAVARRKGADEGSGRSSGGGAFVN
jgi:iron complex transport system ATP-binding protein